MKFMIFVAVALFAALMSTEGQNTTLSAGATTKTTSGGSGMSTKGKNTTLSTGTTTKTTSGGSVKSNPSAAQTKTPGPKTITKTTTKPIKCKNGTCSEDKNCISSINAVLCAPGQICAVYKDETSSNFTLKCESPEDCKKAKEEEKADCCESDDCTPEKYKNSGCDSVWLNLNVVISLAFMFLLTL